MGGSVRRRAIGVVVELAVIAAVALASCAPQADEPAAAGASPETSSPSASATATPTPTATPTLPTNCSALLPDAEVVRTVGQLGGSTTYVLDVPAPGIGRVGRVTCGYGVNVTATGGQSTPILDASLMLYVDAASAQRRVDVSVSESRARGETVTTAEIAGQPGYAFETSERLSVVGIEGTRTVLVGIEANRLPPEQARQALITLANRILTGPTS
jgi:hypothetical protein